MAAHTERPGEELQIPPHDLFWPRAAGSDGAGRIRCGKPVRQSRGGRVRSQCRAAHCDRAQADVQAARKTSSRRRWRCSIKICFGGIFTHSLRSEASFLCTYLVNALQVDVESLTGPTFLEMSG